MSDSSGGYLREDRRKEKKRHDGTNLVVFSTPFKGVSFSAPDAIGVNYALSAGILALKAKELPVASLPI